jgi:hypothetical protein
MRRVKPGDHPEFHRLPPPAGTSRESGIVLDRHGRFWHDGRRVEHAGMARAFHSWIARHPDDGRFILDNGFDWTYFEVEDVPFLVRSFGLVGGEPVVELSDGSCEGLDVATLRLGPNHALYADVKRGSMSARFTSQAQSALAPFLRDEGDEVVLEVAGRRTRLGSSESPAEAGKTHVSSQKGGPSG